MHLVTLVHHPAQALQSRLLHRVADNGTVIEPDHRVGGRETQDGIPGRLLHVDEVLTANEYVSASIVRHEQS